jgi:hypothetical protein
MNISYEGYQLTKKQKSMVDIATNYALDSLTSKRMKNSLDITIRIEKDLYEKRSIWGDMCCDDEERSPKYFDIRLNYSGKQSFATLIKVLCHELIHVVQFATRRLRYLSGPYRIGFLSEHYSSDVVEYDDRPWEIEAHELEDEVFEYVKAQCPELEEYFQKTKGYTWEPALDQSMVRN